MTHICVSKLIIIGSDNGLSRGRRQAFIWTNAWILLIGPWGTNFSESLITIQTFSFKKMHLKMSSAKWRPFCHGLNVLSHYDVYLYFERTNSNPVHYGHFLFIAPWTCFRMNNWGHDEDTICYWYHMVVNFIYIIIGYRHIWHKSFLL